MGKRIVALILALVLACGLVQVGAAGYVTEDGKNYFYLVTETAEKIITEPMKVYYEDNDTVLSALMKTDIEFDGLEDGWINAINGEVGNFTISDQNGQYDLERAASEIEVLRFSEDTGVLSENRAELIKAMCDYSDADNGVDMYEPAASVYKEAHSYYIGMSDDEAGKLAESLKSAMKAYEGILNGDKREVTFNITKSGSAVPNAEITVENAYGKSFSAENGKLSIVDGEYTYKASLGYLSVEGKFTVSGKGITVNGELPSGGWYKEIDVSGRSSEDYESAIFAKTETADHEYTFDVPDLRTGTSIYPRITRNEETATDASAYSIYAVYTATDGSAGTTEKRVWNSTATTCKNVMTAGAVGNTVLFEIRHEDADGNTQIETITANFVRTPSLKSVDVLANGKKIPANKTFDGNVTEYTYSISSDVSSVVVTPHAFGSYDDGYSVTVNGSKIDAGEQVELAVKDDTAEYDVTVGLANGNEKTYKLTFAKKPGSVVSFSHAADVTVEVFNGADTLIEPIEDGTYSLITGETYKYVATKNTYYHSSMEFTATEGLKLNVAVRDTDWLDSAAFGPNFAAVNKGKYPLDSTFASSTHEYKITISDNNSSIFAWATQISGEDNLDISAKYTQMDEDSDYNGVANSITLESGAVRGKSLPRVLVNGGYGTQLTLRVTQEEDGVKYYQDYIIDVERELSLKSLDAAYNGAGLILTQTESGTQGFDRKVDSYTVSVPFTADKISINAANTEGTLIGDLKSDGYSLLINGESAKSGEAAEVALDGTAKNEEITITVCNEYAPDRVYTITVIKLPPVFVKFNTTPENAVSYVKDAELGTRVFPDENGIYELSAGSSYIYTVTKSGYVGISGTLSSEVDNTKGVITVANNGEKCGEGSLLMTKDDFIGVGVTLSEAPENTDIDSSITSEWSNFRGNDENNAVTSAASPIEDEDAELYWATKLGDGYSSDAVGSPILVDGYLITYARNKIFKVDTISGEVVATGTMDHSSSFSITPPLYAEGMIFVALSDGSIQAFNAKTLESLWIYRDALKGQPNCPITYSDGYIYTGFWNSEAKDANFVCISITDEDPTKGDEDKLPTWTYSSKGGYYWAGAYACDKFVLVGTDDGHTGATSQTSALLALDPKTGILLDSLTGLDADVRSNVSYDEATDRFYFTSKGGTFYSVEMEKDASGQYTGKINHDTVKKIKLTNGTSRTAMSTSTPVIYNGRAYIGVSGEAQFGQYSGHNITVIDLTTWRIAYTVPTQGYPQTSGLLTTAYEDVDEDGDGVGDGYVYVYFIDNYTPGKLRVLKDRPGQKEALLTTEESYTDQGVTTTYTTPYVLFTPSGDQAQYAICSPIVDEYGTIYFKNDSAHLMALGSSIEKIEITSAPTKTVYTVGETFDSTGMTVMATYANGATRDVTNYVTYTTSPLTEDDTQVRITFEYVMYQNKNGEAGVYCPPPSASVDITINGADEPKANGLVKDSDGVIRYYKDGAVDTEATGLAKLADGSSGVWYYVENGVFKAAEGIAQRADGSNDTWYYVDGGIYDKNGAGIARKITGGDTNWYYVEKGEFAKKSGVARYADGSSSNWFYVENGVYTKASGIAQRADGSSKSWYYVKNGKYTKATGLARYADGSSANWYFVKNGVYTKGTGIAQYADGSSNNWYYVKNGKYTKDTGITQRADGGSKNWYYVQSGKYRSNYTGLAPRIPDGKLFYVKGGVYRSNFSGTVTYNGKRYTVKNGVAV